MWRTRLLWFTLGFAVSGSAIAHFVWRDLTTDRRAIASDMKDKFDALETRVQNIENSSFPNPNLSQMEEERKKGKVKIPSGWYEDVSNGAERILNHA